MAMTRNENSNVRHVLSSVTLRAGAHTENTSFWIHSLHEEEKLYIVKFLLQLQLHPVFFLYINGPRVIANFFLMNV